MTKTKPCTVKILNKSYEIKSPEGEESNLLLAAQNINDRLLINKNKFKRLDDYQALLLAALELSHELILCKNDQEQQRFQVTQFIASLENKINTTVSGTLDTANVLQEPSKP